MTQKTTEAKLIALKREEEEQLAQKLAENLNFPYLPPNIIQPQTDILMLLTSEQAQQLELITLSQSGNQITAITPKPSSKNIDSLSKILKEKGQILKVYVVSKSTFKDVLQTQQQFENKTSFLKAKLVGEIQIQDNLIKEFKEKVQNIDDFKKIIEFIPESKISSIIELILIIAIKTDASDIHIEPRTTDIQIRLRIDGVLHDITKLPLSVYKPIISRIKILSGLKLNITKTAQDGRFSIKIDQSTIDVRVSSLPSPTGENIVMRILNPDRVILDIKSLGLEDDDNKIIEKNLQKTIGMILTTGPTGSGKTTTLYACLNTINRPNLKIITIEDPIEYKLQGIEQTQVDVKSGYTFANGLRAIVRQDPDVILVGEMRDLETVDIGLNAALTGHLVFSTLHTNDAPGAISRMVQLGAKKEVIAPALNLVIAQRLIRRLCSNCKKEIPINDELIQQIKNIFRILPKDKHPIIDEKIKIYQAQGCEKCNYIGYKGRIAVFEMMEINADMQQLIIQNPSIPEIKKKAIVNGMKTLLQDGYIKILKGITSIEEVERVVGVE